LGLLYVSLYWWGIAGAAIAWCVRVTVDLLGLLVFARKINPGNLQALAPYLWVLLLAVGLLIPSVFNTALHIRIIEVCVILIIYVWVSLRELKADGMLEKIIQFLKLKLG
jgi:FtsH-binding integral membrane protein